LLNFDFLNFDLRKGCSSRPTGRFIGQARRRSQPLTCDLSLSQPAGSGWLHRPGSAILLVLRASTARRAVEMAAEHPRVRTTYLRVASTWGEEGHRPGASPTVPDTCTERLSGRCHISRSRRRGQASLRQTLDHEHFPQWRPEGLCRCPPRGQLELGRQHRPGEPIRRWVCNHKQRMRSIWPGRISHPQI
jgi:hypothetical protein